MKKNGFLVVWIFAVLICFFVPTHIVKGSTDGYIYDIDPHYLNCTSDHCVCSRAVPSLDCSVPGCIGTVKLAAITNWKYSCCLKCNGNNYYHTYAVQYTDYYCYANCNQPKDSVVEIFYQNKCDWCVNSTEMGAVCGGY